MALRLIRIILRGDRDDRLREFLDEEDADRTGTWRDDDEGSVADVLVASEEVEGFADRAEERFADTEEFRLVVLATEAVLPRPDEEEEEDETSKEEKARDRISREELYADVTEGLAITPTLLALAGLSAVVAAVGLLRDDVAVIIGAMVIAPLLRPNVALALAATLADRELAWKAALTNAASSAFALAIAVAAGLLFAVDPSIPAIAGRSSVDLGGLLLALAAGAAGTLAFARGFAGAVIGVMVAVALLPPLVSAGLLLGAGHLRPAFGAFLLTAANLVSINLAGVVTFLLEGVRPRSWWEAERAKKAALWAAAVWLVLLLVLGAILVLAPGPQLVPPPGGETGKPTP